MNFCFQGCDQSLRALAVDVGCGSGQSTTILAPHFDKVVGLDISAAQIDEANKKEKPGNVEFG